MTTTIAVFGITGRTGAALAEAARRRGLQLVGLARRVADIPSAAHLRVRVGNLADSGAVQDVMADTLATICVFGPRPPHTDVFCAPATASIIAAMRATRGERLLCQTGAMIGALPPNVAPGLRWMAGWFARSRPQVAADRAAQEQLVRESGLAWTLIKPSRLRSGPAHRPVRAGPALTVGLLSSISRSALADFLLDEATVPRFVGQAVYVRE